MAKFTRENAAALGKRGGTTTAERHGAAHMAKIGRVGYERTRDKHFAGSDAAMGEWLHRKGTSATDGRMREAMPWLRPITTNPGTPAEFLAARRLPDFVVFCPYKFRPNEPRYTVSAGEYAEDEIPF